MQHRPIAIRVVLNGYIATVGCQTAVFQSLDGLLDAARKYLLDPQGTERVMAAAAKNGYDANGPYTPVATQEQCETGEVYRDRDICNKGSANAR